MKIDKRFIKLGKASGFILVSAILSFILTQVDGNVSEEIVLAVNAIINVSIYFAYNEIINYKTNKSIKE